MCEPSSACWPGLRCGRVDVPRNNMNYYIDKIRLKQYHLLNVGR